MQAFDSSRRKIERAHKHIEHINTRLMEWVLAPEFHSVSIERDNKAELSFPSMRIEFDRDSFPATDIALITGDALHNLRSALDLMWFEIVAEPSKWTRFPVRDTRDELIAPLNNLVKQKQVAAGVADVLLDTVKPYEAGNYAIWALDDLNIRDKHQLLVPVLQLVRFDDICLEDDKGASFGDDKFFITEKSTSFRLDRIGIEHAYSRQFTVKDKGKASAAILFNLGVPFQGEAVIPSLNRIAEEVTRTLDAFGFAFGA